MHFFIIWALVWSFPTAIVVEQIVMTWNSAVHSVQILLACEISCHSSVLSVL